MNIGWHLLYLTKLTPWDRRTVPVELASVVEGRSALSPGRALDLGCGTGTHAVYLARHGWLVTGVDGVGRALGKARSRAAAAGVEVDWRRGDVSALAELGLQPGYSLILDVGCFHGLPPAARAGYARGLSQLSAAGATFLLMGFAPGHRGPAPRGTDTADLEAHFGREWELVDVSADAGPPPPGPLRNAKPTWYRLTRRVTATTG